MNSSNDRSQDRTQRRMQERNVHELNERMYTEEEEEKALNMSG